MNQNKENVPGFELNEETLNEVSGGLSRGRKSRPQLCMGGCGEMTTESLGYCKNCQKKFAKQGIPLII